MYDQKVPPDADAAVAADDDLDWLAITGGIVLALGIAIAGSLHHIFVDYDIYGRLEKLEKD